MSVVIRVTNFHFIVCLFLGVLACAQSPSDQLGNALETKGNAFLDRKITYSNTQPLLSQALKALNKEGINIVFSSTVLGTAPAPKITGAERTIREVMDQLLGSSSFDYIVIGHSLAIVSGKVKTDSSTVPSRSDTMRLPHVLSGQEQNFNHIPAKDRRRIKRLLQKELQGYGLEIVSNKDSIEIAPLPRYPIYKIYGQLGLARYNMQERSSLSRAWREELGYNAQVNTTGRFDLGVELEQKFYFVRLGIAVQELSVQYSWMEMKKNGAQVELPDKSNAQKLKYLNDSDRWLVFSLPLSAGYLYRYQKHSLAPVLSLSYQYFGSLKTSASDKYSDYNKVVDPQGNYSEHVAKSGMSVGLSVQYAYRLGSKLSLNSLCGYTFCLNPLTSNSVFNTYAHYWAVQIGASYAFR
jgi:hypothetical protein